ncbi:hypothetical protein D3C86_2046920 [compost metagenome]
MVTFAPILLAISRSSAGGIIRSFWLTMYQEGRVFHAATVVFSPNAFAWIGPCVAAMTRAWAAGTSCAKSLASASGGNDR